MNVRKFIAANARDALRKVKETLGNDAIILSNRGIPGGVEIMAVAARDMAMIVPTQVADSTPPERRPAPAPVSMPEADDDYRVLLSSARANLAQGGQPRPVASAPTRPVAPAVASPRSTGTVNAGIPRTGSLRNLEMGRPQQSTVQPQAPIPNPVQQQVRPQQAPQSVQPKPAAEVVPMEVMDEIRSLRRIVEQHLAGFAWGESARSEPVKTDVLRQMLDAGFSPQFARDLLADLPLEMDGSQAMAWVKGAADRSLFTIGNEGDIVDRGGVYALVGPTGVGKTTTTAKLAARCVLRHGPSKVALVTTDGYRIGAHEQLRIYGRILGVSVYLVKDAAELRQTLKELQHKHMVLVDTMGMSQKDKLVPELTDMLAGCDVQRLLLLSSTSRGDTLDDVVRAYEGDNLAGCILTKIDEAASLATPLDVIMRHGLKLHYVSNGQRVPEDLHLPNRGYLLHRAFKDVPDNSPHKYDGVEPGLLMANAGMVAAGGRRG
ncbi:flagellar biosynthesis protein FlhF [Quatrionicoccus australiensis]|uniref:flagellar biosynthesis protein FlhF n=1 Tax=Quatrionicoccus australiensis TaxID=138118 RepID=UPI001CF7F7F8|nr:flagellar biosynthesis protein FlhF [Quatrionicoccus australiensis]UCV15943.1 flagellar biosynthesis protein FlhF [Quatrionicoccus australiensis]